MDSIIAAITLTWRKFFPKKKAPPAARQRVPEPKPVEPPPPEPPAPPEPPKPRQPKIHPVKPDNVEWLPSPCFKPRPGPRSIRMVVLHATEGSYESAIEWLRKPHRRNPSSAHYIIAKDGRVAKLVREQDVAWHAIGVNGWSLGVELETVDARDSQYTQVQLNIAMFICLGTCLKHGVQPMSIVGHDSIDPKRKTDPIEFPWPEFRWSLAYHIEEAKAEAGA